MNATIHGHPAQWVDKTALKARVSYHYCSFYHYVLLLLVLSTTNFHLGSLISYALQREINNNSNDHMKGTITIHLFLLLVSSRWHTVGSVDLGYDCADYSTCGTPDFCSEDGVCHQRTCETFYRYAQESLTGRGNRSSSVGEQETEPQGEEELECYVNEFPPNNVVEPPCPPNEDGGGLFPIAVYHTCRDNDSPAPPSRFRCWDWYEAVHHSAGGQTTTGATTVPPRFATMNRVCTAKPNPEQRFICYDIAPETDLESYFDNYLAAVESMGGCGDENSTINNNDDDVTNRTTALGHVVTTLNFNKEGGGWTILNDASRDRDGKFDPFFVAGISISTIVIDDSQPDDGGATSISSTSSPHLTGVVSTIVIAIMTFPAWFQLLSSPS